MVDVSVNGRQHAIQCGVGEEARIKQLAAYLDRKITELGRGQSQIGDSRLLLLASIVVTDELSDAWEEINRLRRELEHVAAGHPPSTATDAAADMLVQVAERIESIAMRVETT